jgi:hypothetical protein
VHPHPGGLQHQLNPEPSNPTLDRGGLNNGDSPGASRISTTLRDIVSPATYVDAHGIYVPETHQLWMLNIEQLLSRIGAIHRHPTDQAAQLMLMFPALDILAGRLGVCGNTSGYRTGRRCRG